MCVCLLKYGHIKKAADMTVPELTARRVRANHGINASYSFAKAASGSVSPETQMIAVEHA